VITVHQNTTPNKQTGTELGIVAEPAPRIEPAVSTIALESHFSTSQQREMLPVNPAKT
jgi:hypothetical protein